MKRFSIFHPLALSFFSADLYREVARRWTGLNYLYLLMLLAVLWIPSMVQLQAQLSKWVNEEAPKIVDKIPLITIKKGKASIRERVPYTIQDPETGEAVVIIDISGKTVSLEGTTARVLLMRDQVLYKKNDVETRSFDLSKIEEFELRPEMIHGWLAMVKRLFIFVAYPCVLAFSLVFRILQSLIYGAIALLFASMLKTELPYPAGVRLAVVAVTPVLIIDTLVSLAGLSVPFWWLLGIGIALGYLFFGVKAAAEPAPSS